MNCINSTENREKEDKTKEEKPEEPVVEEMPTTRKRHGSSKEEPPALMATFFAGLEVYKTKMLVSDLYKALHLGDNAVLARPK